MSRKKILNIYVDDITVDGAVKRILQYLEQGKKTYMVTPNAEIGYAALYDGELTGIINEADLVLPDGAGLVLASRIVKNPLSQKTSGAVTAQKLLGELNTSTRSLFILGGSPDVSKIARENIMNDYPGIKIMTKDGYFGSDSEAVEIINSFAPDVLFVCLGAPKQELFIGRNFKDINCTFSAGLGGTVDILANTVKPAPIFFVKYNLEWAYRLIKQPWRLIRMLNIPKYLLKAIFYK